MASSSTAEHARVPISVPGGVPVAGTMVRPAGTGVEAMGWRVGTGLAPVAPWAPRPRSRWTRDTITRVQVAVVVAVASVWMWWLVGTSWFFADDYANLALARRSGLTADYLTTSVVGHLVVGYRLVDWFLATQRRYDYGLASVAMVAVCALALWTFSRVLVALIGPRTAVAALTAVMAASMLLSPVMLWWAAFLHTMPAMLATLTCMLVFLWWERRPRLWHLPALAVVAALGLCFYETTLLVPGYLALLSLLVLERGGPLRRLRGLLRRWPVWLSLAVPCGFFLWYYTSNGYSSGSATPTADVAAGSVVAAWAKAVTPSFAGINTYYLPSPPDFLTIGLAGGAVLLVAIVVAAVRAPGRTARAVTLGLSGFVLSFLPFALTRAGTFGTGIGLNHLYLSPMAWLVPLAAALAWFPTLGEHPDPPTRLSDGPWTAGRAARAVAGVAVGMLVIGLGVHGQIDQTHSFGWRPRAMRTFVQGVEASLPAVRDTPGAVVYDTTLPPATLDAPAYPVNLLSNTVGEQFDGIPFIDPLVAVPTDAAAFVARPDGVLVPAAFRVATRLRSTDPPFGDGSFCVPASADDRPVRFTMDPALPSGFWSVRLSGREGSVGSVPFNVDRADGAPPFNATAGAVGAGESVTAPLPDFALTGLLLVLPPGGAFCGTAEVGTPVPAS